MNKIAIVILNWNGADMMRRFLPDVVKFSPADSVVVADNGSTDDSLSWLSATLPAVRQVVLGANYGFAEG
ncbi:MAG: glycosyltransferase family 2 protein, partial [Bacteroidaceae bacterium]|nr:glycosyltransferase family 2 protein [Bacteroidaceae bacterium]